MKFELKDLLVIGGVVVSLTAAFVTLQGATNSLDERVDKLEKLELEEMSGRVDRLACKINQLRRALTNQPPIDCPD